MYPPELWLSLILTRSVIWFVRTYFLINIHWITLYNYSSWESFFPQKVLKKHSSHKSLWPACCHKPDFSISYHESFSLLFLTKIIPPSCHESVKGSTANKTDCSNLCVLSCIYQTCAPSWTDNIFYFRPLFFFLPYQRCPEKGLKDYVLTKCMSIYIQRMVYL